MKIIMKNVARRARATFARRGQTEHKSKDRSFDAVAHAAVLEVMG